MSDTPRTDALETTWTGVSDWILHSKQLERECNRMRQLLEDYSDVRDGADGRPRPNIAMQILADLDQETP